MMELRNLLFEETVIMQIAMADIIMDSMNPGVKPVTIGVSNVCQK